MAANGAGHRTHITSIEEPFPSPDDLAAVTTSHKQANFVISTRKLPISKAGPIEALEARLAIPVPEMIFGDNLVHIGHQPSGWAISFNAADALDAVDKTAANGLLQVAHAREWSSTRDTDVRDVVRPYDWSYSTTYKGTVQLPQNPPPSGGAGSDLGLRPTTTKQIPIELLKRRDPILFFDEVVLYESELDDNGVSLYSCKLRVHEHRMLLLSRLFLRVDGVVLRVRDTRVYVDFDTDDVLREYTAREAPAEHVRQQLLRTGMRPDEVVQALRDPNQISELLPVVENTIENVTLKG